MNLYQQFTAAVAQADRNAIIILAGTLLAIAAWMSIAWLPVRIQPTARLIAWAWALTFLAGSILYSL